MRKRYWDWPKRAVKLKLIAIAATDVEIITLGFQRNTAQAIAETNVNNDWRTKGGESKHIEPTVETAENSAMPLAPDRLVAIAATIASKTPEHATMKMSMAIA